MEVAPVRQGSCPFAALSRLGLGRPGLHRRQDGKNDPLLARPLQPGAVDLPPGTGRHAYGWWVSVKGFWLGLWLAATASTGLVLWAGSHAGSVRLATSWAMLLFAFSSVVALAGALHGYSASVRGRFSLPGRKKIPVHGLFHTLYDVVARPHTLLRTIDLARMRKHGDIYLTFVGTRPMVVVTAPDLAEKVSKAHEIYSKSDPRDLNMPFFFEWVGNNNVVLSNGDDWQRLRKIVNPALTSVQVFLPVFHRKSLLLCDALDERIETADEAAGTAIRLNRWLKAMSLDAAGEALFGYDFNHLREIRNPGIDAMDFVINEVFNPIRIAFPLMNDLPLPSNRRLRECMGLLDRLVLEMITSIRQDQAPHRSTNVLEMLIRERQSEVIDADELKNNILAMVLASHETTQVSLGAVLSNLARYPSWQERLRREAEALFPDLGEAFSNPDAPVRASGTMTFQKLHQFRSMDNFILESLRLYSPLAHQNPRTATRDTELGGYRIPAGTLVSLNLHAIHMNSRAWEQPDVFDPGRFDQEQSQARFAYLPFGGGPRVCSGRAFSLLEQKVVLCHLIRRFRITLPTPDYQVPLLRGSFTGKPDDTFRLVFSKTGG